MSILDALKTQTNSIDELAALPQAMIMQMAQKGQIREDMLAPILGRKAEMADAVARTRALQNQGGQQSTVMEQIMQRNAEAETPMPEARAMGVAQLPVREDMFDEQRMAGGGIVAFARGDLVEEMTEEERAEYIKNNPYLQRAQAIRNAPAGFVDFMKEYNPITGSKFREGVANIFSGDGMSTYEKGRKARTGEIPMFVGNQPTEKGQLVVEGKMRPEQNLQEVKNKERKLAIDTEAMDKFDQATTAFEKERAAKLAGNRNNLTGNVTTKDDKKPPASPLEDLFTRQEKLIESEREAAKAARDEAKWMRLAEAGLGIASGDSPYALSNLKGAMPALRGYGEDIAGLRKEERQRTKDLMEIQKERAEMDYKGKLLRIQELAATKPDSTSQIIALGRKAGLDDRALLGLLAGNKDTENSAKNIATKAYFENPMNQQKYGTLDKYLSAQGFGVQAQLPPGIPPNSVQVGTSKGKPVYKAPDGKQYIVS
jgi:hypothetical protein